MKNTNNHKCSCYIILVWLMERCNHGLPMVSGYQQFKLSMSSPSSNTNISSSSSSSNDNNNKNFRRRQVSQVNDIIQGIGLQPVFERNNRKEKKIEKESPSNVNEIFDDMSARWETNALNSPQQIDINTQLSYSREGHAVLRSFFRPSLLSPSGSSLRTDLQSLVETETLAAWQQKVAVASQSFKIAEQCQTIQQCRNKLTSLGVPTNELPFLQFFNTWRKLPIVEALCKSPLLASAASQLMGIPRVRLYQDSLFLKRSNDGKTPWHVDARMSPFDTPHFITFWIPVQEIPSDGTALIFVNKSHSDMALPYWNDINGDDGEYSRLEHRYGGSSAWHHYMPMDLGDVTVHSGWTLHCADANKKSSAAASADSISSIIGSSSKHKIHQHQHIDDRYALAVTYVDARAEVRKDVVESIKRLKNGHNNKGRNGKASSYRGDDEDTYSFLPWIKDVKPRTQFSHDLVPLVWPTAATHKADKK